MNSPESWAGIRGTSGTRTEIKRHFDKIAKFWNYAKVSRFELRKKMEDFSVAHQVVDDELILRASTSLAGFVSRNWGTFWCTPYASWKMAFFILNRFLLLYFTWLSFKIATGHKSEFSNGQLVKRIKLLKIGTSLCFLQNK